MRAGQKREGGFTYIGLLMAVVVMGLMLTVASRVWSTTEQRERETQLLWVGHAYRLAIASYFAHGHQYPATLQQLLLDDRQPVPFHHLRKLYFDPMTGQADWTLVITPSGAGIMGVASSSQRTPIKRQGFDLIDATFKDAECYCNWKFVYTANRWGVGLNPPGLSIGSPVPPSPPPGSQLPPGPTTAPGVPLAPVNANPSLSPSPSSPTSSGSN
jgi:type II secretory pathway pseudopilin PulG